MKSNQQTPLHNLSLIHISEPTRLLSISYAVFDPFVAGPCGADRDAGRIFAVQAGFGEVDELCWGVCWLDFIGVHTVEERAGGGRAIGVLIRQGRAVVFGVPSFACDHAGVAADTGIKVDDEAEFAVG